MTTRPVAVTIGDPAGIGPEISLRCALEAPAQGVPPLLVGSAPLLRRVASTLDLPVQVKEVGDPSEPLPAEPGTAYVVDVPGLDVDAVQPGVLSPACGQASFDAITVATRLAVDGIVSAVASAPANKAAFNAAGHHFEGQTEIFASLTGTTKFHTILVGGPLRVSLVSSHCSMSEAIRRVHTERVERILLELDEAMRGKFGVARPRIGVAGLNPHAGENGVLGREEIEQIQPAVERCRARGVDATDPLAADSLFNAAEAGDYDAVLAMYHDQGAIPLKRYGYVTYAAGLPIVRTTAGHGTAFDIAWTGKARHGLLARAIALAAELGSPADPSGTGR
jgi:4-phospho-D-threonate 3-dehydrogenase / 4-phospho-D-erythronate 3-dehydrogenase